MLNHDSNPTCGILYIDDEEKALKYFRMAFSQKFKIFTALSGPEGLETLRREAKHIGIVMSDQKMPEMRGADVLSIVRDEFPRTVRILTTAYTDLDSAIQAVNKGHIYQYVVKPWEIPELGMVLQRAADYYHVASERDELLSLKMTTLQRILCSDRLKWLLLSCRSWSEAEQAAFRRALIALIKALPDTLTPASAGTGKFSARDFDISALIRSEYHNASRCLDAIEALRTTEDSADRLKALLAELAKETGVNPDQIELASPVEPGGEFHIRLRPGLVSMDGLSNALFGVLVEREIPELSLLLFGSLISVAAGNGVLTLSLERPDGEATAFEFAFPEDMPDSPDEAIGCLYEKFASWDVARL